MLRTITLGTRLVSASGWPVSGEVECCASHSSMALRSYVSPSQVRTGSSISSWLMGHSSSAGRLQLEELLLLSCEASVP